MSARFAAERERAGGGLQPRVPSRKQRQFGADTSAGRTGGLQPGRSSVALADPGSMWRGSVDPGGAARFCSGASTAVPVRQRVAGFGLAGTASNVSASG